MGKPVTSPVRVSVVLRTLIARLDSLDPRTEVIPWAAPIPSFGDLSNSRVATVGLNPSNREFVDEKGDELQGALRRFPTLQSLRLSSWSDTDTSHRRRILKSCRDYFQKGNNPYNEWFKRLNQIVLGAHTSYYGPSSKACHIDLIPYATATKWGKLKPDQRTALLDLAGDTLGLLLRASPVRVILLNGTSVVERFQVISGVRLDKRRMSTWSLPRSSRPSVPGFSYTGLVDTISEISLGHKLLVLGFNHNIPSSWGVPDEVVQAIRKWIGQATEGNLI